MAAASAPIAEAVVAIQQELKEQNSPSLAGTRSEEVPAQLSGERCQVRRLGQGGNGVVFKLSLHGSSMDVDVAIKVAFSDTQRDGQVIRASDEDLLAEGRILTKLSQENGPSGVIGGLLAEVCGICALVMPVAMGSLHDVIYKPALAEMKATMKKTPKVVNTLLAAIEHLHRQLCHCDLKPENVLVFGDGTVKIADFGAAITVTEIQTQSDTTGPHPCLDRSTAEYMPPECLLASSNQQQIYRASDFWALGALFFEMGTGRRVITLPMPTERQAEKVRFQYLFKAHAIFVGSDYIAGLQETDVHWFIRSMLTATQRLPKQGKILERMSGVIMQVKNGNLDKAFLTVIEQTLRPQNSRATSVGAIQWAIRTDSGTRQVEVIDLDSVEEVEERPQKRMRQGDCLANAIDLN